MNLSSKLIEKLENEELVWINGGVTSVEIKVTNNADGRCTGTNNASGTCGGTNNGSGVCG